MSLGEYAPLSESKRPCVPRPALFALFGALLWAVVGLTATLATLSAAEVEVTAVEANVPPGRCDHAQVALNVSYRLRRNMLAEKFRQGFFLPDPVAGAVLRVANASRRRRRRGGGEGDPRRRHRRRHRLLAARGAARRSVRVAP